MENRIREQFRSCPERFEILRASGYESDDDWFEVYDRKAGVEGRLR